MARPKKQEIALSELERKTLLELTRSRVAPHGLVRRAEIVLASADGEASTSIARRVGVSMPTVGKWRTPLLHPITIVYAKERPKLLRHARCGQKKPFQTRILERVPSNGDFTEIQSRART
jgi:putative transposase